MEYKMECENTLMKRIIVGALNLAMIIGGPAFVAKKALDWEHMCISNQFGYKAEDVISIRKISLNKDENLDYILHLKDGTKAWYLSGPNLLKSYTERKFSESGVEITGQKPNCRKTGKWRK